MSVRPFPRHLTSLLLLSALAIAGGGPISAAQAGGPSGVLKQKSKPLFWPGRVSPEDAPSAGSQLSVPSCLATGSG